MGQPDAGGRVIGGSFSLTGGFWALYAVQTPGAPRLSIAGTTTNTVAVFWPSPSTGWTLQQNANGLNSMNWSNVTSGIQDDGANQDAHRQSAYRQSVLSPPHPLVSSTRPLPAERERRKRAGMTRQAVGFHGHFWW